MKDVDDPFGGVPVSWMRTVTVVSGKGVMVAVGDRDRVLVRDSGELKRRNRSLVIAFSASQQCQQVIPLRGDLFCVRLKSSPMSQTVDAERRVPGGRAENVVML